MGRRPLLLLLLVGWASSVKVMYQDCGEERLRVRWWWRWWPCRVGEGGDQGGVRGALPGRPRLLRARQGHQSQDQRRIRSQSASPASRRGEGERLGDWQTGRWRTRRRWSTGSSTASAPPSRSPTPTPARTPASPAPSPPAPTSPTPRPSRSRASTPPSAAPIPCAGIGGQGSRTVPDPRHGRVGVEGRGGRRARLLPDPRQDHQLKSPAYP